MKFLKRRRLLTGSPADIDPHVALHVGTGDLSSYPRAGGCWVRGCPLLVWPALWALKGSWANNLDIFKGDVVYCRVMSQILEWRFLRGRPCCNPGREWCARAVRDFLGALFSPGFVLTSACFCLGNDDLQDAN